MFVLVSNHLLKYRLGTIPICTQKATVRCVPNPLNNKEVSKTVEKSIFKEDGALVKLMTSGGEAMEDIQSHLQQLISEIPELNIIDSMRLQNDVQQVFTGINSSIINALELIKDKWETAYFDSLNTDSLADSK